MSWRSPTDWHKNPFSKDNSSPQRALPNFLGRRPYRRRLHSPLNTRVFSSFFSLFLSSRILSASLLLHSLNNEKPGKGCRTLFYPFTLVVYIYGSYARKTHFISMVYINECMNVNTALRNLLQIYELFAQDPTVSKEFPLLASPWLYLGIFFQIYDSSTRMKENHQWLY